MAQSRQIGDATAFGPPAWWALFRLLVGGICALGFGLRATPAPSTNPGFLGMLIVDTTCLWFAVTGLCDLLCPWRVRVLADGLALGRRMGRSLPWGDLVVRLEYVRLADLQEGRFRRLEIGSTDRTWKLGPGTLSDRPRLVDRLRAHRNDVKEWGETVMEGDHGASSDES